MKHRKRRGPIPRGAFDAALEIARGAVASSPFYSEEERKAALHVLGCVERGTLTFAGLKH